MESDTNAEEMISAEEGIIGLGFSCLLCNPLWHVTCAVKPESVVLCDMKMRPRKGTF